MRAVDGPIGARDCFGDCAPVERVRQPTHAGRGAEMDAIDGIIRRAAHACPGDIGTPAELFDGGPKILDIGVSGIGHRRATPRVAASGLVRRTDVPPRLALAAASDDFSYLVAPGVRRVDQRRVEVVAGPAAVHGAKRERHYNARAVSCVLFIGRHR